MVTIALMLLPEEILSCRFLLTVSDNSDWVRDKEYCVFTQSSGHSSSNSPIEDGDDDCKRNDDELFGEHLLPPVLLINMKEQPRVEVDTLKKISKPINILEKFTKKLKNLKIELY